MDVSAFKAQLEAARRIETDEIAGARFTLQLPTEHAFRRLVEANRDAHGQLLEAQAFRALLDTSLVAWAGVTWRHLDPDGDAQPMPFDAETRQLLLEHRQDIADRLMLAIGARMAERRAKREAGGKNSPPASTGS